MTNPFLERRLAPTRIEASDGQALTCFASTPTRDLEGGPALVFVHGGGVDHRMWNRQLEHFGARRRCLAVDVRGHGMSRPTAADFDLDRTARDLVELLDHLEIPAPVLVGQSMGALIGQAAIRLAPGRVGALVSVDSVDITSGFSLGAVLGMRSARPMLALWPYTHLSRTIANAVATTDDARAYTREVLAELGRADFLRMWRMVERSVGREPWPDFTWPRLLIVVGREDGVGLCRSGAEAWSERAGADVVWLEGAGHNANQDAPDAFNAALEAFVRDLGDGDELVTARAGSRDAD